jgi:hypothetical protein
MKRHIIILISMLLLASVLPKAQTLISFFARYDHDKRFETVSVGRFLFGLALISGNLSDEEKEIVGSLRQIKVLSTKDNVEPEFAQKIMRDLNKVIDKGNFESLVEVRSKGEKVEILVRKNRDTYTDLLISARENGEVNVIWIRGKLTKRFIEKIKIDNNNKMTGLPVDINL